MIIYFYHTDVAQALGRICDERGSQWEDYQVNWKLASPYGTQRPLLGFDGLVELYRVYPALCDDLFSLPVLPKLAILNDGDWTTYYRAILTFLQLPPMLPARFASGVK